MIYISIGSNLGNRKNNLEKAKYLLILNGINIIKSSNFYESLSWPDPNKPKFINIVIQSNTKITGSTARPNMTASTNKIAKDFFGASNDQFLDRRIIT